MGENPKLAFLSTNLKGQSIELEGGKYTVGRTDERDICIPDATVSSLHCSLTKDEEGNVTVQDEGSTNGTRLNGKLLEEPKQLGNNDILMVGEVEMLFKDANAASGETDKVPRYHSNINLNDQSATQPLPNMSNISPFSAKGGGTSEGKLPKLFVWGISILLGVGFLGAFFVLYLLLRG